MLVNKISLNTYNKTSFEGKRKKNVTTTPIESAPKKASTGKAIAANIALAALIGGGLASSLSSCEKDEIPEPINTTDTLTVTDTLNLTDTVNTTDTVFIDTTPVITPPVILEFNSLKDFQNEFNIEVGNADKMNNAIDTLKAKNAEKVILTGKEYKLELGGTESKTINDDEPILFIGQSNEFSTGGYHQGEENTSITIENDQNNIVIANGYYNLTIEGYGDNKEIIDNIINTKLGNGNDDLTAQNIGGAEAKDNKTSIDLGHGNNNANIWDSNVELIKGGNDKDNISLNYGEFGEVYTYEAADKIFVNQSTSLKYAAMGNDSDYISNDPEGNSFIGKVDQGNGDDGANLVNIDEYHGGPGADKTKITNAKLVMGNNGDDEFDLTHVTDTHLGLGADRLKGEYLQEIHGDQGDNFFMVKNVTGTFEPGHGNNIVWAKNVESTIRLIGGHDIGFFSNVDKIYSTAEKGIYFTQDEETLNNMRLGNNNNIINGTPQSPRQTPYTQEELDRYHAQLEDNYEPEVVAEAKQYLADGWDWQDVHYYTQRTVHPFLSQPITKETMYKLDEFYKN